MPAGAIPNSRSSSPGPRMSVTSTVVEDPEARPGGSSEKLPPDELKVRDGQRATIPLGDAGLVKDDVLDIIWVHWDGPDDPANPTNWSKRQRWVISSVGVFFCALVSFSVTSYSITQESIMHDLHASKLVTVLGLTLFTLTFGATPLLLAPISEEYGRSAIYFVSAVCFTLFYIPQALARNIQTMLVSRFISGMFGSTAVSLVGGTISDVWLAHERGLPMALFSYGAFMTTGLAPVCFGIVEQKYGFRLVCYIMLGLSGAFTFVLLFILKETRASVILSRKAARLRKETGDDRYRTKHDHDRTSFAAMMKGNLARPVKMLFTEPVLISFTLWISFCWACLYILIESIATTYGTIYGFSISESGYVFSSQVVGSTVGLVVDHWGNKLYQRKVAERGPEARLYNAMFGGVVMPIGAWIYAWTARESIHWIVPCIGVGMLYCGMYLIYLTTFSYLADSYTLYASSALSAQSFVRNLVGAIAPLFTNQMYAALGIGPGGTIVAALSTVLAATPFILYAYGKRLRERSKFAQELAARKAAGRDDR